MLSESTSEGGVSVAQKWIGGGLIGLVLLGLVVAFVATPMTAADANANAGSAGSANGALRRPTTATLNADTGADTTVATAAFAAHQSDVTAAAAVAAPAASEAAPITARRMKTAVMPPLTGATPIDAPEAAEASSHHILTESDNGKVVALKVGQNVAIRLKENRTTGYGWQLENPTDPTKQGLAAVPSHLELVHDQSRKGSARSRTGKPLVGVPGQHVFVLRATAVGQTEVCATYRRPWLPPATTDPAQTYCVKLDVSAGDKL